MVEAAGVEPPSGLMYQGFPASLEYIWNTSGIHLGYSGSFNPFFVL